MGVFLVLVAIYCAFMLLLPAPKPTLSMNIKSGGLNTGQSAYIQWPSTGSAAIGAVNYGVLQTNNSEQALPIASMAKVVLAMTVLRQRPLAINQSGPIIAITDTDYGFYLDEINRGGSTVAVKAGEEITQYQALQGLLLPSGNNMASTLANWAFGSKDGYIEYANDMLKEMGLNKTVIDDTSGFASTTVSTADELVKIGIEALKDPVIKEIVSQKSAEIPVAGEIVNTNSALGVSDIDGIKTGQTDDSGDCLLFSATRSIAGQNITLVGALQGQPGDDGAIQAAPGLVDQGYNNFVVVNGASTDEIVGTISVPWAPVVNIKAAQNITQVVWSGTMLAREVTADVALSGVVGQIKVGNQVTDLVMQSAIQPPTAWWRLTHPIEMIKN